MANEKEVKKGLEKVVAKFEDPELKEEFKRFFKSIQFVIQPAASRIIGCCSFAMVSFMLKRAFS